MQIADVRRDYVYAALKREDLSPDPLELFTFWFEQASRDLPHTQNAMTLATANQHGLPSVRTVLLKHFDAAGFVFYTDYTSPKGRDLAENPQAALLFQWLAFDRQVSVQGRVEKTTSDESQTYFASRPRDSQLAAYISKQSQPVESRQVLMDLVAAADKKFADAAIPLPLNWGGYRLKPSRVEFLQGRPNRLNDRFEYLKQDDAWQIRRLSP